MLYIILLHRTSRQNSGTITRGAGGIVEGSNKSGVWSCDIWLSDNCSTRGNSRTLSRETVLPGFILICWQNQVSSHHRASTYLSHLPPSKPPSSRTFVAFFSQSPRECSCGCYCFFFFSVVDAETYPVDIRETFVVILPGIVR